MTVVTVAISYKLDHSKEVSILQYPHVSKKIIVHPKMGTAVAQCLRCYATNRKFAGSIPDGVVGIFH